MEEMTCEMYQAFEYIDQNAEHYVMARYGHVYMWKIHNEIAAEWNNITKGFIVYKEFLKPTRDQIQIALLKMNAKSAREMLNKSD